MAVVPTRRAVAWCGAAAVVSAIALLAGLSTAVLGLAAAAAVLAAGAATAADLWRAHRRWRAHPLTLQRCLPAALALGRSCEIEVVFGNSGPWPCRLRFFDHPDGRLVAVDLPLELCVPAAAVLKARYRLHAMQRGAMRFAPAQVRLLTPWGLFERCRWLGDAAEIRVYPDFAQVARYAWLAGDRRLAEIGIKSQARRGEGTDFKELAEYRPGDDIRHLDWKASQRLRRPIVRQHQDERDQCVMFLLDAGRRMRAAEDDPLHGGHFDQALNAMLLLAHVALASGDEVGAMTYGGEDRHVAPRKGRAALQGLMAALYDVQPGTDHADLQQAAVDLMRRQPRRALVVVITNVRDEDAEEVAPALALLRRRHLVLLASLREPALREAIELPLTDSAAARRVAAAHALEQARRDAFARLSARDALLVDAEPRDLAPALVNRYHAVKRAGLL